MASCCLFSLQTYPAFDVMSSLLNLDKRLNHSTLGETKPVGVLSPPGLEKVEKDVDLGSEEQRSQPI